MRLILASLLVVGAVLCWPGASADAAVPATGTGTVSFLPAGPPQISSHGGNTFIAITLLTSQTGVTTGTGTEYLQAELHPNGTETFQAWQTATLKIDGKTGPVLARIVGTGANGTNSGHIVIVSASGGLTGLHGEGTFTATDAGATYTLMYHFTP